MAMLTEEMLSSLLAAMLTASETWSVLLQADYEDEDEEEEEDHCC